MKIHLTFKAHNALEAYAHPTQSYSHGKQVIRFKGKHTLYDNHAVFSGNNPGSKLLQTELYDIKVRKGGGEGMIE